MKTISPMIDEISRYTNIEKTALINQGLQSLLKEKKKNILLERLKLLSRYSAKSIDELEHKIADGEVKEHPAWEDLIVIENLETELKKL
ncbi:conserved hypothetical protein [Candidatus Magnetomoraceae bacterium gMMP-15]